MTVLLITADALAVAVTMLIAIALAAAAARGDRALGREQPLATVAERGNGTSSASGCAWFGCPHDPARTEHLARTRAGKAVRNRTAAS